MKKPRHPVTDHCVLRHLERVMGLPVEELRREIGHKVDKALELGASGAVVDGFVYRIVDGHVVTVAPHKTPDPRTCRKRSKS